LGGYSSRIIKEEPGKVLKNYNVPDIPP